MVYSNKLMVARIPEIEIAVFDLVLIPHKIHNKNYLIDNTYDIILTIPGYHFGWGGGGLGLRQIINHSPLW